MRGVSSPGETRDTTVSTNEMSRWTDFPWKGVHCKTRFINVTFTDWLFVLSFHWPDASDAKTSEQGDRGSLDTAVNAIKRRQDDVQPEGTDIFSSSLAINASDKEMDLSSWRNDTRQSTEEKGTHSGITNSRRLNSGLSVSSGSGENGQTNHTGEDDERRKKVTAQEKSEVYQSKSNDEAIASASLSPEQTVDETKDPLTTEMTTSAQRTSEKMSSDTSVTSINDRKSPLRCYTCNLPGFPKCDDPFLIENGKLAECPSTDGKRYFCGKLRGVISSLPDSAESITLPLQYPKNVPITESIDKWTSNVTYNLTFRFGDEFIARLCFPKLHEYVWRREPYNLTHKHGDITVVGRVYLCRNTRCNESASLNPQKSQPIIIMSAIIFILHSLYTAGWEWHFALAISYNKTLLHTNNRKILWVYLSQPSLNRVGRSCSSKAFVFISHRCQSFSSFNRHEFDRFIHLYVWYVSRMLI